ncbi:hypothetical protein [Desulforhopalus singaporensis]|uniref:hypothetical protein n=1 Tax=Desulforhopalus singaporensis TaxID=91360 RepID=UPI0015A3B953|nr:hypothetical protein [Desulforhopalus singaporensis]
MWIPHLKSRPRIGVDKFEHPVTIRCMLGANLVGEQWLVTPRLPVGIEKGSLTSERDLRIGAVQRILTAVKLGSKEIFAAGFTRFNWGLPAPLAICSSGDPESTRAVYRRWLKKQYRVMDRFAVALLPSDRSVMKLRCLVIAICLGIVRP